MSITSKTGAVMLLVLVSGCSMITERIRILPESKFDHSEKYKMTVEAKNRRMEQLQNECSVRNTKPYCAGIDPIDVNKLMFNLNSQPL